MRNYLDLGLKIINEGKWLDSRNGKIKALFGEQLKFDLTDGFPLMTTKYINFEHIKHETFWYLKGTDKIDYLKEHNINIWNLWADENNSIGPTYGVQWRNFNNTNYDQVLEVIRLIKEDPFSRRIIINGWSPSQLDKMALPPCLVLIQFHVDNYNKLHTTVYQRSADFCLGVPYDIAEMALLTYIIAEYTNKQVGTLTVHYGNIHFYEEHIETFKNEQLFRSITALPKLFITNLPLSIDKLGEENTDIILTDYNPRPRIKYKIKE